MFPTSQSLSVPQRGGVGCLSLVIRVRQAHRTQRITLINGTELASSHIYFSHSWADKTRQLLHTSEGATWSTTEAFIIPSG